MMLVNTPDKSIENSFEYYCLERTISCLLRDNPDCFKISVHSGYYGQETGAVNLDSNVVSAINKFVDNLKVKTKKQRNDMVELILTQEYGYVIPALKDKDWEYHTVPLSNIFPGNENYRNTDRETVTQYSERLIEEGNLSCLCKRVDDKYILVDGYHRFAAANKRGDKAMKVMWCEV